MKHLFPALFFLLFGSVCSGQIIVQAGGTYGFLYETGSGKLHRNPGTFLGFDLGFWRHWSIGGVAEWQFFEPQLLLAYPKPTAFTTEAPYSVVRHQVSIRPTLRVYLFEPTRGPYVGGFGSYVYQTIKTNDYPTSDLYSQAQADPTDRLLTGTGLLYGYRFKIKPHLLLDLSGSHQFAKQSTPEYDQQNHQFALGLGWSF
jgi:hypothetical protein